MVLPMKNILAILTVRREWVDIELHSRFYTAWAKAFDLLDSNPMTSSSPPLQVSGRADIAELKL